MSLTAILNHGASLPVALRGWTKQSVDPRDADFAFRAQPGLLGSSLPERHDNLALCSPVEDQGNLGSCTAQTVVGLVECNENRRRAQPQPTPPAVALDGPPKVDVSSVALDANGNLTFSVTVAKPATPTQPSDQPFMHGSRLFQYYATRLLMNTTGTDSGASMRTSIKAAATYGVADEALWPYLIPSYRVRPPEKVWQDASPRKITSYHAIANGDVYSMKAALTDGFLVAFGFVAYAELLSASVGQSGLLPMPRAGARSIGGHAVCLVGYDDTKVIGTERGAFLVRNSWGPSWGLGGYFWMPYAYVRNPALSSDFWVVQSAVL